MPTGGVDTFGPQSGHFDVALPVVSEGAQSGHFDVSLPVATPDASGHFDVSGDVVTFHAAQSGTFDVSGGAQSGTFDVALPGQSGTFDVANWQSGTFDVQGNAPQSGHFDVGLPLSGHFDVSGGAQSGMFDVSRYQSGRFDVSASGQSGTFDVSLPSSPPPPPYETFPQGGREDPESVAPLQWNSSFRSDISGDLVFSFDFSLTQTWRADGWQSDTTIEVDCNLGFRLKLLITDIGKLTATLHAPAIPDTCLNPYLVGPNLLYQSKTSDAIYAKNDLVCYPCPTCPATHTPINAAYPAYTITDDNCPPTLHYLSDGESFTASGTFTWRIHASEYKQILLDPYGDPGTGEPDARLYYSAYAWPGYPFSFSFTADTFWGISSDPHILPSGTFGVNQGWVSDPPGAPCWDGRSPLPAGHVVYRDSNGAYTLTNPLSSVATISAGMVSYRITDSTDYGPYISPNRSWNLSLSNIRFGADVWTPLPYNGNFYLSYDPTNPYGTLNVQPGSIVAVRNGSGAVAFIIKAASATHVNVLGRIYYGDDLDVGTRQFVWGHAAHQVTLTATDGLLSASVEQILSHYNMPSTDAQGNAWHPALPADRNDYVENGMSLLPRGVDSQVYLLDDYSWTPTTFTHLSNVSLDDFSDVSLWTVTNGTKGSSAPLAVTSTAAGCKVTATSPYNKDCRNYRYLHLAILSAGDSGNTARGRLSLVINGEKTFQSAALVEGAQTLEFDLCHPQGVGGIDRTRTGWDSEPDGIYGVQAITDLEIKGFITPSDTDHQQTVTFTSLSLIRKGEHCPGRVVPEATAIPRSVAPEVDWYCPDVPAQYFACPIDSSDPDEILPGLLAPHRLFARILSNRVDGKRAADLPHAVQRAFDMVTPPFVDYRGVPYRKIFGADRMTIAGWVQMTNQQAGLHATNPVDGSPSLFYNSSLPAVYLTLDSYTPKQGSTSAGMTAATANLDTNNKGLQARVLLTAITNYPGQFTHREYAFIKRLGSVIEGLVINPSGGSAENIPVQLMPCNMRDRTPAQSATTDADGYFRFKGSPAWDLLVVSTNEAEGPVFPNQRQVRWVGLAGSPSEGKGVSYAVSEAGRHVRAYLKEQSIRVAVASGPVPQTDMEWQETDTHFNEAWPVIAWQKRSRDARLWLMSIASNNDVHLRWSKDEGATWTMSALTASGTTGAHVWTEHGLHYIYYRTTDGALKGQIQDAQGNTLTVFDSMNNPVTEFTIVTADVGIDDAGLSADEFVVGGGEWRIGLLYWQAGNLKYKSSKDGFRFS